MGLALVLLIFPSISQLVLGSLSVGKEIRYDFKSISLINLFFQALFSYVGIKIIGYQLDYQRIRCGLPLTSYFFGCVFFLIILVLIILIQIVFKKVRKL